MTQRNNSIDAHGGTVPHIDMRGDIFKGEHFVTAVRRGVNKANLRKLFGTDEKPLRPETIEKWLSHLK